LLIATLPAADDELCASKKMDVWDVVTEGDCPGAALMPTILKAVNKTIPVKKPS